MTTSRQGLYDSGRFINGELGLRHYIHVYAIAPVGGGNIKFGRATNVKSRFSGIQTGSPVKLELIGSALMPVEVEFAIHEHLADYRSHGEWFLPTVETVSIAELIRDKKAVDLLARIKLFSILPVDVLRELTFQQRMDASSPARSEFQKSHSGSSVYSARLKAEVRENPFYIEPSY